MTISNSAPAAASPARGEGRARLFDAPAAPPSAIALNDGEGEALKAIAKAGGGATHVALPKTVSIGQARSMRDRALIDIIVGLRGALHAKLTPAALQALVASPSLQFGKRT